MITPLDIQNKEFRRSLRGYNEAEVDEFLDDLMRDYEKIYKENLELKDKILVLNEQIDRYNNLENTLKETLIVAQSTADEVIAAAKEKAKSIIDSANIEAKKLIDEANEEVHKIRKAYENLLREMLLFKTRYRSFIEAQLTALDEFYSEIEGTAYKTNKEDTENIQVEENEASLKVEKQVEDEKEKDEDVDQLGA